MTQTCGGCRCYSSNSCFSVKAALSLLDDIYRDTPACEHFEPAAVEAIAALPTPPLYRDPLDMLSDETRSKLNHPPRRWQEG